MAAVEIELGRAAGYAQKQDSIIEYVNSVARKFELMPYHGKRYEAIVPDTLDIPERASLAVNALTEQTNPLADYEYYCGISILTRPPSMWLNCWYQPYTENQGGALLRNRVICLVRLNPPEVLFSIHARGARFGLATTRQTNHYARSRLAVYLRQRAGSVAPFRALGSIEELRRLLTRHTAILLGEFHRQLKATRRTVERGDRRRAGTVAAGSHRRENGHMRVKSRSGHIA